MESLRWSMRPMVRASTCHLHGSLDPLVPRCGHEIPRGHELARSHSGSHSASHGGELEGLHGLATVARDTIWSARYP